MKKAIVIIALLLLTAASGSFVVQNLNVQQTSNLAVATASSLSLTGSATSPIISQCNASPPTGSTAKGSLCLDPTNGAPWVYNGTAWATVGGGGVSQWTSGTASAGTTVYDGACSYVFTATATTSTEPCWDLGDGTSLLWTRNNVFSASNNQIIFISGATSTQANIISNSSNANWRDMELIVDVNISGTADAFGFGIYDAAQSSTRTGAMVTGSYGVELDIFNSQVQTITNGSITAGSQIPVRSGIIKNNGTAVIFDRWYLDFHDLGNGNSTVTLYRNHQNTSTADNPYGPCDQCFGASSALKRDKWASWQITTPSFSSWKFIAAARTGGSGGNFYLNKVQARSVPGTGSWKAISTVPDL